MALIYCSKCRSSNTSIEKEKYNKQYEFYRGSDYGDLSIAGDIMHKRLKSYDVKVLCKCNNCGHIEEIKEV